MKLLIVLSIAGSDNSGGAGIQADLKTFSAWGCYGTTAITCVVAEHPGKVKSIEAISPQGVRDQIDLVAEAFEVKAFKTGMLYSEEIIESVVLSISQNLKGVFFVLDPVMVASSGAPLLKSSAMDRLKRDLIPQAGLVTPNRDEAALLWGKSIESLNDLEVAGRDLVGEYGVPFLMKGGHFRGEEAIDLLVTPEGVQRFSSPRIPHVDPHGTGCTYSAAIVSAVALGKNLEEAVQLSKRYITRAIQSHLSSRGYQVLNHQVSVEI